MDADGPALLAAAVDASIKAMAPRRTTTGVAAAVAGAILAHRAAARAKPAVGPSVPAGTGRASPAPANGETSPEDLLEALREARRTQRRRKKARRRAAQRARAREEDAITIATGPDCGGGQAPEAAVMAMDDVQSRGEKRHASSSLDAVASAAQAGVEEHGRQGSKTHDESMPQNLGLTSESLTRHGRGERSRSPGLQRSASLQDSHYTRESSRRSEEEAAQAASEQRAIEQAMAAEAEDVAANGSFELVASRRKARSQSRPIARTAQRHAPYKKK
jgi:hypothetical protein